MSTSDGGVVEKTGLAVAIGAIGRNAAASTMGASVVSILVTPLDVAKVRMQSHVCPVGGSLPCPDPAHPAGTADMMRRVVRSDGLRGLWRGLGPTLVLAVPTTGLYFTMYEAMRDHASIPPVLAGAFARFVAATTASPLELARTQLQSGAPGGVVSVIQRVVRNQGTPALWRGLAPTLLRDIPFSSIYWGCYESIRRLGNNRIFEHPTTAGFAAGSLAALCTTPADVVKTRRQAAIPGNVEPPSIRKIVSDIVKIDGARGFFRGASPRIAKVGPSCAIMMGSYEQIRKWLGV